MTGHKGESSSASDVDVREEAERLASEYMRDEDPYLVDQLELWLRYEKSQDVSDLASYSMDVGKDKLYLYGVPKGELREEIEEKPQYRQSGICSELEKKIREPIRNGAEVVIDDRIYNEFAITLKPELDDMYHDQFESRDMTLTSRGEPDIGGFIQNLENDIHVISRLDGYEYVRDRLIDAEARRLENQVESHRSSAEKWRGYARKSLYTVLFGLTGSAVAHMQGDPFSPEVLYGITLMVSGLGLFSKSREIDEVKEARMKENNIEKLVEDN